MEDKIKTLINFKRFFRNIWLISILSLPIFFALYLFYVRFLNPNINLYDSIPSFMLWSIVIVGTLSFFSWIFLLIFHSKLSKIIALIIIFIFTFYIIGMFLIIKIRINLNKYEELQSKYSTYHNELQPATEEICKIDIQKELKTYDKLDDISTEMKLNLEETKKIINIAQKIVISKKYRVDVLDKMTKIYENQSVEINLLKNSVFFIDSLTIRYWCNSYLEFESVIKNINSDYKNNNYSNMSKYLDVITKNNESRKQYVNHLDTIMKEIYILIPNHKYDLMEWENRLTKYYTDLEKLNMAMVSKNKNDINYYYDSLSKKTEWFNKNPSSIFTSEIADSLAKPNMDKLNKIISNRSTLWSELDSIDISILDFFKL